MSESGADSPKSDQNSPTGSPQVSTVVQGSGASQSSTNPVQVSTPVPTNLFTGTIQDTLGFTTSQIKVLIEEIYYTQDAVLYWKCTPLRFMVVYILEIEG